MYESVACYYHRKGSKKEQDIDFFFETYFKSAKDFSKLRRVKSYP